MYLAISHILNRIPEVNHSSKAVLNMVVWSFKKYLCKYRTLFQNRFQVALAGTWIK